MSAILVASANATGNGSSATTNSRDTTGATLIVLMCSNNASASALSPSDNKSNTWTALTAQSSAGNSRIQLFYCSNPTVGSGHTFSTGTSTGPSICMMAFSNGAASSPFDQQNGASTSGATSLASGSITPGQDNELIVFGFANADTAAQGVTVPSGVSVVALVPENPSTNFTYSAGWALQTTAAAINVTWTWPNSKAAQAVIASFKTAASGGSGGAWATA